MNFKIVKRLALALAMIICLTSVLASCGVQPIKSTDEEAAVIGTIGKYEVKYEELRYLVLNFKKDMALRYGEDIWTDPAKAESYRDELWAQVSEKIVSDYYAVQAMADYYYVGGGAAAMMTEDAILDAVQDQIEEIVDECGSKKKYKQMLAEQYLTDSLLRFYTTAETCATELFFILVQDLGMIESSEEYITEYMHSDDFIRTNHIFLQGATAENLALAEQLYAELKASDNPEMDLILRKGFYCADYTMTTIHGKYFARYTSDYGDEYETAAFALRENELSGIVEAPDGYYIIIRLPVEEDYLTLNFEDFKDDILGSEFNKHLAEYKKELSFELNELGKSIDILEIE